MVPFRNSRAPTEDEQPVATDNENLELMLRAEKAVARYMVDFLSYYCAESEAAHCMLVTLDPARYIVRQHWKTLSTNEEIIDMLRDPSSHVEEIREVYALDKSERKLQKVGFGKEAESTLPIYIHSIFLIDVTLSAFPYEKTLDAVFMTMFNLCDISGEVLQHIPEKTVRASAEVAEIFGFPYVHLPVALTAILPPTFKDGALKLTAFYDVPDEGRLRKKDLLEMTEKTHAHEHKETTSADIFAPSYAVDVDAMFETPADPVKFLAEEYEKLDLNPLPNANQHFLNTLVVAKQPAVQFNAVHQSLSVFSLNTHSDFTVLAVVENESSSTDLLDHVFKNLSVFASSCLAIPSLKKFRIIIVNSVQYGVKFDYTKAAHKNVKSQPRGNRELKLTPSLRPAMAEYIHSPYDLWEYCNQNGTQCQFAVFEHNVAEKVPEVNKNPKFGAPKP